MNLRADIVELLRAGCSDREVSRRLNVDNRTASRARAALGLPRHRPGPIAPSSLQDAFRQRTRPVDGGHLEWTGHRDTGTPFFRWATKKYSPARVAFVMQHGRAPVGNALPGCDYPGCVAPAHITDRPMRDRLNILAAAIFGDAA